MEDTRLTDLWYNIYMKRAASASRIVSFRA